MIGETGQCALLYKADPEIRLAEDGAVLDAKLSAAGGMPKTEEKHNLHNEKREQITDDNRVAFWPETLKYRFKFPQGVAPEIVIVINIYGIIAGQDRMKRIEQVEDERLRGQPTIPV